MNHTRSNRARLVRSVSIPLAAILLLLIAAILLLRQFGNPSLVYPDADRILMDGVFIADLLKDRPSIAGLYDYTTTYYAQYPGLSIGYRPPLFPLIEAPFHLAFGVSQGSGRLALITLFSLGVVAWFRLVSRLYDPLTGFLATLLLVTNPFVIKHGWYTLAELPMLSLGLISAYLFHRYLESGRVSELMATAGAFVLAVWTKQIALMIGLWFLLHLALTGQLLTQLRRPAVWLAFALVLFALAPLAAVTIWLGDQNLAQSIGVMPSWGVEGVLRGAAVVGGISTLLWLGSGTPLGQSVWRLTQAVPGWIWLTLTIAALAFAFWTLVQSTATDGDPIRALWYYPSYLRSDWFLEPPLLIASLLGLGLSLFRRSRAALLFVLLILAVYLFVTPLVAKSVRYAILWMPAWTLFAASWLFYLRDRPSARRLGVLLVITLSLYQLYVLYSREPRFATGFDTAAQFVLDESRSATVFFDGYNNGYFTFFMRALDPARTMVVLRGDKLLTSSSVTHHYGGHEIHAATDGEFQALIDKFGIELIVVEYPDTLGLSVHERFRDFLDSDRFELLRQIPIRTNQQSLKGAELRIYRYREWRPASIQGELELPLPIVGKTLHVPLRRLPQKSPPVAP